MEDLNKDDIIKILNHHSESLILLNKETTRLNNQMEMMCHILAWFLQSLKKATIPTYKLNEIEELKLQLAGAITYYNEQRFSKKKDTNKSNDYL